MAIVTIAHETGSGGPEIGIELAKRLGWRYVDRDMLSEAAHRYGVGEDKLTELDEKKPSLFERFDVETRQYITVIQSAVLDIAEKDNVVINSRGGQVLLRGISHALRVFVIAPFELRVKRVMPPNECATSTAGPWCQDRTSFVASTLACRLVSGFCTAVAFKP